MLVFRNYGLLAPCAITQMWDTRPRFVAQSLVLSLRILISTVLTLDMPEVHRTTDETSRRRDAAPCSIRTAYLLSRYPAISHTFLLHEVLGLRELGFDIETASINSPDRTLSALTDVERAEAQRTFCIKAHSTRRLRDLLCTAILHPAVVVRALRTLLALPGMTLRHRLFGLFYVAEALLIGAWMRQRRLQHLHVHFGGAVATVGMLTAAAWRLPYSLTIHGPEELLDSSAYHLRQKLDDASFVFCISDFCRSQLCRLLPPHHWRKLHVVRLGVDTAKLQPAAPAYGAAAGRRSELVCTGRLVPDKGQAVLLQALAQLKARGLALHTTLIGAGVSESSLRADAARLGLTEDDLHFAGALSHPETLTRLRAADLFVLASFAEGVPVALMEAMSMEVPVVSTSIAGIPELVRHGKDGLLVPPGNSHLLADALFTLLADPGLRRRLGASARQQVSERYELRTNLQALAQAFLDHLQPGNLRPSRG